MRCGAKTNGGVSTQTPMTDSRDSALQNEHGAKKPQRLQWHWPCFLLAMLIMVGGTLYPPFFADAHGKADHTLAYFVFWAMAAGFVRGVGYIPKFGLWRVLFSSWAAFGAFAVAIWLKWGAV